MKGKHLFKFTFIFAVLALSQSCLAKANPPNTQIRQEVMASFESLVQASRKLNSTLYFQHFDVEKFVGLNSNGTNWNSLGDLTPLITKGFKAVNKVNSLEFTNVKISVIDSYTAILVNEYKQSMTLKNEQIVKVAGGGTQVWSKRSGEWKIVSISASNKPHTNPK